MKRRIEIHLGKDGDLTYSYPRVHVERGDEVEWAAADDNILAIALHFQGLSPFDRVRYRCSGQRSIAVRIRTDTPIGQYKYFVAVLGRDHQIWTDDPEMIVDR